MAQQIADRVKETTTTTGTGALTLGGAMVGFRAFSAVLANADTCYYALQAVDSSGAPTGDWEVGLGTYTASGNTLARTTLLSSSTGAFVSLAAGTKQVWLDVPAVGVGAAPYMQVHDEKPSGTAGGGSTSGIQTRVLNTVLANTIPGASLDSNQITLPAGTYQVDGSAPANGAARHQAHLYNVTDAAVLVAGTSEYAPASSSVSRSYIVGTFTLNATKSVSVRHSTGQTVAASGLGIASITAFPEVYTVVTITKVG